jgi:hypothetical protein
VSTGCAAAGSVSVVQEPLGFPATGNVPDPASLVVPLEAPESLVVPLEAPESLVVPLEAPESLAPLPELPLLLVGPELCPPPLPLDPAPLDPVPLDPAPLEDPLEVLAPLDDSPPSSPAPGPLPELDSCDEPPSLWPEALFAREPALLHPMPSAKESESESTTRSARIVILPSKYLV